VSTTLANIYAFGGRDWSVVTSLPAGYSPQGPVACALNSACFSIGVNSSSAPGFVEYAGGTWSAVATDTQGAFPTFATQLSCGSATVCAAVTVSGGGVNTFDGTSWTSAPVGGSTQLQAVSCASSTFCAAVDNGGNYVTYDGTVWSTPAPVKDGSHIATPFVGLGAISCSVPESCTAVDNSGNVWRYSATAATWSLLLPAVQSIVTSTFPQGGISCPTTQFCAIVSGAGAATYDGGTGMWTLAQPTPYPTTSKTLDSVSCTSSSFCVAVDQNGFYTKWDGSSWSAATQFASAGSPESVSCLSSSLCVAAGGDGNAETYNGTAWSNSVQVAPGVTLGNPSCVQPSTSLPPYCAVSAPHAVYYLELQGGAPTWSAAQPIPDNNSDAILALGCAPSLCVATGAQNHAWEGTP
jgi:hypothetical protein